MEELGVRIILALSPQAKGRVERTAGTFQDRLITDLRLAGATTMEQAKAVLEQFLPRFNRRFQVPAQVPWSGIPTLAVRSAPGASPVTQTQKESGPGQHREVPEAHPAVAAWSAPPLLYGSSCVGVARTGRPAVVTA